MQHQARRAALTLCFGLAACATPAPQVPSPHTNTADSTSQVSQAPTTPTPVPTSPMPASSLLGTWESASGDATLIYRFTPDGRYAVAGVLTQPRGGGSFFRFTRAESGTATVQGQVLTLQPTNATSTRDDPEDTAGNYTDRPEPLKARQFQWTSTATSLTLVDHVGIEVRLRRQ